MAFARDRDLLVMEPGVFRDAPWSGQTLVEASDASLSGVALVSASSDFAAAGVGAGHGVIVGGASLEVVERVSETELVVSRLREGEESAMAPSLQGEGLALVVASFAAQIAAVHAGLLRSVGLAASESGVVMNPEAFARAEALGALHMVFFASSAGAGAQSLAWRKAELYLERFVAERGRLCAEVDLNGDGVADALRTPGVARLVRG